MSRFYTPPSKLWTVDHSSSTTQPKLIFSRYAANYNISKNWCRPFNVGPTRQRLSAYINKGNVERSHCLLALADQQLKTKSFFCIVLVISWSTTKQAVNNGESEQLNDRYDDGVRFCNGCCCCVSTEHRDGTRAGSFNGHRSRLLSAGFRCRYWVCSDRIFCCSLEALSRSIHTCVNWDCIMYSCILFLFIIVIIIYIVNEIIILIFL